MCGTSTSVVQVQVCYTSKAVGPKPLTNRLLVQVEDLACTQSRIRLGPILMG